MPLTPTTKKNPADLARALRSLGPDAGALRGDVAAQAARDAELVGPAVAAGALAARAAPDLRAAAGGASSSSSGALAAATRTAPARSGKGGPGALRHDVEKALAKPAPTQRAPDAAPAIAAYLPKGAAVARPLERALVHVGRLHTATMGKTVNQLLEWKTANDVRKHLFMLQGLLRAYEGDGKSAKKIGKQLERVKAFEDVLGAYDYALSSQKAAVAAKLDPRAVRVLDDHVVHARAAAREMIEDGWLASADGGGAKRLQKLVDAFVDADLGSAKEKKDAGALREVLHDMIDDVAEKAEELDVTKLETGLHELRRALRWIPITFMALDGLVVLDERPGPIAAFEALKQDPVAQSPYSKLPATGLDQERIAIPQSLFLALSKAIDQLGALKDQGQAVVGFAEALQEAGVCKDKKSARAAAERLVGEPGRLDRIDDDAERARDALVQSGLLKALARAVAA